MSSEFEHFLEEDLSEFEGQWVAIKDGEVIFNSENEREVRKKVKESDKEDILISKVPKRDHALAV
jgi:hypothetical protein